MNIYKIVRIAILLIFITQFTQLAYASGVRVGWVENPVSDVAGYRVHYGTASRNYQIHVDAGTFTSIEIDSLSSGTTYYFAVTAYDYSGNESAYSQEIQATMPAAPAVNAVSGANSVSGSSSVTGSGSGSLSVSSSGSGSSSNTVSSSGSGSTDGSGNVTEAATYTLSTSVVNASGTISATQSTEPYVQGAIVSLTATPDSGFKVMAWTGTDDDTSINNTNTVTMNADRTVSVEFEPVSKSEENKAGGGGSGGGCFISTPVSESPVSQGVTFLAFAGMVLMGISGFLRRDISN